MILFIYGFMLIILIGMTWVVIANLFTKPSYNGFLWLNPEHLKAMPSLENIITINRQPEGQKPFFYRYDWWRWKEHPIYLWYEDNPITETKIINGKLTKTMRYPIKHYEPDTPADYKLEAQKTIPYVTPTELYDNTDWDCIRRILTVKSKAIEAIKLGMAMVMVIVCVVVVMFLVSDASNKKSAMDIINTLGVWM